MAEVVSFIKISKKLCLKTHKGKKLLRLIPKIEPTTS